LQAAAGHFWFQQSLESVQKTPENSGISVIARAFQPALTGVNAASLNRDDVDLDI
jgi:hypothetical protein